MVGIKRIARVGGAAIWHLPTIRFPRGRFNVKILKHTYAVSADRWVVQTSLAFDRPRKSTWFDDRSDWRDTY